MALTQPTNSDDYNLYVYKWKKMSESSDDVDGTTAAFTFESASDVTLVNLTTIDSVPLADKFVEAANGKYEYYEYDTGTSAWVLKKGNLIGLDAKVFFRKNGVDYRVSGDDVTLSDSGSITVTFSNAPTTDVADYVVLSYAYRDVSNPEPYEFCVTDFNPKYAGNDFDKITCIGGKTFKVRKPLDLTEVALTVKKTTNSLSSIMLGDRIISTINSKTVRNTTGGNVLTPRVISIVAQDPNDSTKNLFAIYRDLGATSYDFSGSNENSLEEKITLKCTPDQTIEIEVDA